jgi:hypothetical protein
MRSYQRWYWLMLHRRFGLLAVWQAGVQGWDRKPVVELAQGRPTHL